MINSLSNVARFSQKALMVYLYIFVYIKSYTVFLFQLFNSLKILLYGNINTSCPTCYYQSRDLWRKLNEISLISWIKNSKYIDSTMCLRSRNHVYLLSYMYFIVLGGENVPTNKIGQPDGLALMQGHFNLFFSAMQ